MPTWSQATNGFQPIILVRGFGGLSTGDERRIAYQGFNEGSVYPQKRGDNYIYEGFVLRLMKEEDHPYRDATNVIGYFPSAITDNGDIDPGEALDDNEEWKAFYSGSKIVADRTVFMRLRRSMSAEDRLRTFWVFRYYDLEDRKFAGYAEALWRLINIVRAFASDDNGTKPKVNIVAHSMGGLIVRQAIQSLPSDSRLADESINKIVTLGTPHQGIAFQVLGDLRWLPILEAQDEIKQFDPEYQKKEGNDLGFGKLREWFPLDRLLCVVGTDYRNYSVQISSLGNRLFSVPGEYGLNYNRSDGLVKQAYAEVPGAIRTFVHKPHGGNDSLMTARESYEVAKRFFLGDVRVRVRLVSAEVKRGLDTFGKSELFFGLTVKARRLDFDLFHQSALAENCYGPFTQRDLADPAPTFGWAGENRLIWEGFLISSLRRDPDLVLRAGVYVGERDMFGRGGFSDNIIFNRQYFVRAVFKPELQIELHDNMDFQRDANKPVDAKAMATTERGWVFKVGDGVNFDGTLQIELDLVPDQQAPVPLLPGVKVDQVIDEDAIHYRIKGLM